MFHQNYIKMPYSLHHLRNLYPKLVYWKIWGKFGAPMVRAYWHFGQRCILCLVLLGVLSLTPNLSQAYEYSSTSTDKNVFKSIKEIVYSKSSAREKSERLWHDLEYCTNPQSRYVRTIINELCRLINYDHDHPTDYFQYPEQEKQRLLEFLLREKIRIFQQIKNGPNKSPDLNIATDTFNALWSDLTLDETPQAYQDSEVYKFLDRYGKEQAALPLFKDLNDTAEQILTTPGSSTLDQKMQQHLQAKNIKEMLDNLATPKPKKIYALTQFKIPPIGNHTTQDTPTIPHSTTTQPTTPSEIKLLIEDDTALHRINQLADDILNKKPDLSYHPDTLIKFLFLERIRFFQKLKKDNPKIDYDRALREWKKKIENKSVDKFIAQYLSDRDLANDNIIYPLTKLQEKVIESEEDVIFPEEIKRYFDLYAGENVKLSDLLNHIAKHATPLPDQMSVKIILPENDKIKDLTKEQLKNDLGLSGSLSYQIKRLLEYDNQIFLKHYDLLGLKSSLPEELSPYKNIMAKVIEFIDKLLHRPPLSPLPPSGLYGDLEKDFSDLPVTIKMGRRNKEFTLTGLWEGNTMEEWIDRFSKGTLYDGHVKKLADDLFSIRKSVAYKIYQIVYQDPDQFFSQIEPVYEEVGDYIEFKHFKTTINDGTEVEFYLSYDGQKTAQHEVQIHIVRYGNEITGEQNSRHVFMPKKVFLGENNPHALTFHEGINFEKYLTIKENLGLTNEIKDFIWREMFHDIYAANPLQGHTLRDFPGKTVLSLRPFYLHQITNNNPGINGARAIILREPNRSIIFDCYNDHNNYKGDFPSYNDKKVSELTRHYRNFEETVINQTTDGLDNTLKIRDCRKTWHSISTQILSAAI